MAQNYCCVTPGFSVIMLFADALVSTITALARLLEIGAFFISMIVIPVASNASEMVSAVVMASKKKKRNTSLLFTNLYGSCAMNNCLCLGLFLLLLYIKRLAWNFGAETVTIVAVSLFVGWVGATRITMRTAWAPLMAALFPLSAAFIALLRIAFGTQAAE